MQRNMKRWPKRQSRYERPLLAAMHSKTRLKFMIKEGKCKRIFKKKKEEKLGIMNSVVFFVLPKCYFLDFSNSVNKADG